VHFTYREIQAGDDLQQGDLLRRTPELDDIIDRIHPYYMNASYKRFMILTQSCDLVVRDGSPKADYISICAVRDIAEVLQRESIQYKANHITKGADVVSSKNRTRLTMFLSKLLNNNEPELFYLHDEPEVGIVEKSCAYLRLSISILKDHYDVVRDARILGLEGSFQAKLGWLVGNIYSRVGTEDWTPKQKTKEEFDKIIAAILDENIVFFDDEKIELAKKTHKEEQIKGKSVDELRELIFSLVVPPRKQEVYQAVINCLETNNLVPPERIAEARSKIFSQLSTIKLR
jgi:hypothetical protein